MCLPWRAYSSCGGLTHTGLEYVFMDEYGLTQFGNGYYILLKKHLHTTYFIRCGWLDITIKKTSEFIRYKRV